MFEILKNIDTLKSQTVIGILSGVIILLLLILPAVSNSVGEILLTKPLILKVIFWILNGCAVALLLLGAWNIRKGLTGYGITAVIFGLLWFVALAYSANIHWNYDHITKSLSVCLETASPFSK